MATEIFFPASQSVSPGQKETKKATYDHSPQNHREQQQKKTINKHLENKKKLPPPFLQTLRVV